MCEKRLSGAPTSPKVHISSSCKVGQKLGEILYPLICFFSAVSDLVVAQSIFEIPEGLMNNPVYENSGSHGSEI